MVNLDDYKEVLKKFMDQKENEELLDNNKFKELFIKAIENGIPFDALEEVLHIAKINVNTQQIRDELYLLAIKILKS